MITCISYGSNGYERAAAFNLETAARHGADRTRLFVPRDIPASFKLRNRAIWFRYSVHHRRIQAKGGGFWIWKPFIIRRTLEELSDGDILIYADGATAYIADIGPLAACMEACPHDVMPFSLGPVRLERIWSKRDAFILLDADEPWIADSSQRLATFVVMRKSAQSLAFTDAWLDAVQDPRIVTDIPNRMGAENYPGFEGNRHDQTAFSLLSKKAGYKAYRDPSQFGTVKSNCVEEVLARSSYPQIFQMTRKPTIDSAEKLERLLARS